MSNESYFTVGYVSQSQHVRTLRSAPKSRSKSAFTLGTHVVRHVARHVHVLATLFNGTTHTSNNMSKTLRSFDRTTLYASAVFAVLVSVHPTVCPSYNGVALKQFRRTSRFSTRRLPSTYPMLCFMESRVSPKYE